MIQRFFPMVLSLLLLSACGRRHDPAIHQGTIQPSGEKAATSGQEHSEATDSPHAKVADAVHPTVTDASDVKSTDSAKKKIMQAAKAKAAQGARSKMTGVPPTVIGPGEPVDADDKEVRLDDMLLVAPESWIRVQPPINLITAVFTLPRAEGDARDARLTITPVGEASQEKLDGLRQQFSKKTKEQGSVEQLQISGIDVTLLDFSGTYTAEGGLFVPEGAEGGYRMLNAILPIGGKLYIVNCSGPEKTMGEHADEFRTFVLSMKSADSS